MANVRQNVTSGILIYDRLRTFFYNIKFFFFLVSFIKIQFFFLRKSKYNVLLVTVHVGNIQKGYNPKQFMKVCILLTISIYT